MFGILCVVGFGLLLFFFFFFNKNIPVRMWVLDFLVPIELLFFQCIYLSLTLWCGMIL